MKDVVLKLGFVIVAVYALTLLPRWMQYLNGVIAGNPIMTMFVGSSMLTGMTGVSALVLSFCRSIVMDMFFTTLVVQDDVVLAGVLRGCVTKQFGYSAGEAKQAIAAMKKEGEASAMLRFIRWCKQITVKAAPKEVVVSMSSPKTPATGKIMLPTMLRYHNNIIFLTWQGETSATLHVFGMNKINLLTRFLQDALRAADSAVQEVVEDGVVSMWNPEPIMLKVKLEGANAASWVPCQKLQHRKKETLFLPEGLWDSIYDDIRKFFMSEDKYVQQGQPFRRGYLLYGPPGTGKSTFPVVLAAELGLNINKLDIANKDLTDELLFDLMCNAEKPSVILLEDVDAASPAAHGRAEERSAKSFVLGSTSPKGITLAGLLNALDGVGAHTGHVVIMTTNHRDKLDKALVRAGRCDVHACFGLANSFQITSMLVSAFPYITPEEISRFTSVVRTGQFPAALIMVYIRKHEDVDSLLQDEELLTTFGVNHLQGPGRTRFGGKFKNTYDCLWSCGLDMLYDAVILSGGPNRFNYASHVMCILDKSLRIPDDVSNLCLPSSADEYAQMFLSYFPRQQTHAVRFAEAIVGLHARVGVWAGNGRCTRFLNANFDSADVALESMDEWLLHYERVLPTFTYQDITPEFVLYLCGYELYPKRHVEFMKKFKDGKVSGSDMLIRRGTADRMCGVIPTVGHNIRLDGISEGHAFAHETEKKSAELDAFIASSQATSFLCMNRYEIAQLFMDVYPDVDVRTAMDMARMITSPDGRSGFALRNVCDAIKCTDSLEACVHHLAENQVKYKFPVELVANAVKSRLVKAHELEE